MKIFGYLDDALNWFFYWHYSMGLWNLIIIPVELSLVYHIHRRFFYKPATYAR